MNSSVPIKHISQRISVDGTMLVAAVMYHSNLAAQAPPTGRLSIADDVMLTTYSLITLNFAVCLVIIKLDSGGNKEWAQELHGTLKLIQWVVRTRTQRPREALREGESLRGREAETDRSRP